MVLKEAWEAFAESFLEMPHHRNGSDAGLWLWFMLDLEPGKLYIHSFNLLAELSMKVGPSQGEFRFTFHYGII